MSAYRRQAFLRASENALLDFPMAVGGCYEASGAMADAGVSLELCRKFALTPFRLYDSSARAFGFCPSHVACVHGSAGRGLRPWTAPAAAITPRSLGPPVGTIRIF